MTQAPAVSDSSVTTMNALARGRTSLQRQAGGREKSLLLMHDAEAETLRGDRIGCEALRNPEARIPEATGELHPADNGPAGDGSDR